MKRATLLTRIGSASCALWTATGLAFAARGGLDLEHLRWQPDNLGLFSTQSAEGLLPRQWTFGLALPYSHNPFGISRRSAVDLGTNRGLKQAVVADRITAQFGGAVGVLPWLEVGALIPVVLYNDTNPRLGPESGQVTGLGMASLEAKVTLSRQSRHGIGLAFATELALPTGNHNAFLGQDFVTFSPAILAERKLGKRVRVLANLGVLLRKAATYGNLTVEEQLFGRVGVGVRLHERVEVAAELVGATPLGAPFGADDRLNPVEFLAGARIQTSDQTTLSIGGGSGLSRGYGAPQGRLFVAFAITNAQLADRDRDGTPDKYDRCPDDPGPRSNHGCPMELVELPELNLSPITMPELGMPQDMPPAVEPVYVWLPGPLPAALKAPRIQPALPVPEPEPEPKAPPGEPPYIKAIRTLRIVYFEFDKARIQGQFEKELDQVVKILKENSSIEQVEVGGHTDDIGNRKPNLALSTRRAAATRDYLISKGVEPKRLIIRGYGFDRPLIPVYKGMSTEAKAAARIKNRRVQFEITKESGRTPVTR